MSLLDYAGLHMYY